MKILKQLSIILLITFLGEGISNLLKLPIPGNVLGMLLLLLALMTKIIDPKSIEDVSNYFLNNLAFFFIPASVGVLGCIDILKGNILKILLICIVTTVIVLLVTAYTVQFVVSLQKKKTKNIYEDVNIK
ncbi:MAG: CidA/LrgA family protein [Clostridium argentinense]|uniref:CidA/LrgA family protein n=1 Tax=Clostridium faecium TaxID=2762223 RepID=A0ABR8YW63_9CLOT|nr:MULTISPECIES: CidA/LrgA family protein [Clostridium]MBD8048460.1 CidA/LrgA family protein [Clostridium faecium]MBS5823432.1 CidA/LrgA family protein [Clostridium argentinense]MDU1348583.1 CidA/LrgA family protein [Clostridium argentinense]